jgi:uncharacterized membrane protein YdjX (TVP38/TMEM64 family)
MITSAPQIKNLLILTAVLEAGTGFALLAIPSMVAALLLGTSLDSPAGLAVARVAGVALLALGVACWLARHDWQSRAAKGLVGAMVLYNAAIAAVLVYAFIGGELSGIGLWPVVVVHALMTIWCVMLLLNRLEQT